MKKVLALFPGQGSQKVGMGKDLVEASPRARELFSTADEVLGFSLSKICFEGPASELTRTAIAQPAILTVSSICYELLRERLSSHLSITAAAGHSLGEYSALVAAGAIRFSDAVKLVHLRGSFMQEAVPAGAGAMVAVMGASEAELESLCAAARAECGETVELANVNTKEQIVVAGTKRAVDTLMPKLSTFRAVPLSVSAPFHCSLMKPAAEKLQNVLADIEIRPPQFPVYANVTAAPVHEPEEIRRSLYEQVCGRVRWVQTIEAIIAHEKADIAVEFGTGGVLTGLMKRIHAPFPRASADAPASINELNLM